MDDLSSSASSDSSPIPSTPKESSKEIRRSGRFKRNSIRISTRHEGYKSDGATEEFSSTVGILDLSSITSNDKLVQPSPRKASHGLSPRLKDDSPSSPRRSVSPRKGPSSPRNQIDPDHLSPKSPRLPKLSTTSNDEEKPGCSILFLPRDNRSPSPTADSSGGGSSLIEKDVPKDKDSSPRNSDLVERQSPSSIPSPTSNEVSEAPVSNSNSQSNSSKKRVTFNSELNEKEDNYKKPLSLEKIPAKRSRSHSSSGSSEGKDVINLPPTIKTNSQTKKKFIGGSKKDSTDGISVPSLTGLSGSTSNSSGGSSGGGGIGSIGSKLSLNIGSVSPRDTSFLQTLQSPRLKEVNNSERPKVNPTEKIAQLERQKRMLLLKGANDDQVAAIESQIMDHRREMLSLYKKITKDLESSGTARGREFHLQLLPTATFQELISIVPVLRIRHAKNELLLATISGPNYEEGLRCYRDCLAARTISTYPTFEGVGRAGDPICDFYYTRIFEQSAIVAIADGCNWGEAPRLAATNAATSYVRYLQENLAAAKTTRDIATMTLKAMATAHHAICEGYKNVWQAGTTTLLGGVLIQVDPRDVNDQVVVVSDNEAPNTPSERKRIMRRATKHGSIQYSAKDIEAVRLGIINDDYEEIESDDPLSPDRRIASASAFDRTKRGSVRLSGPVDLSELSTSRKWVFIFASIGDCKAFIWSKKTMTTSDLTSSNRNQSNDVRDCGGRLGPFLEEGGPDLRNLLTNCRVCDEGDILIMVSDGVHDNLDPELLGRSPKSIGLTQDKWSEVPTAESEKAKCTFREDLISSLIGDNADVKISEVNSVIINHCRNVTSKSRGFMETNIGTELPEDYSQFPGKMDHTSCVCLRIGEIDVGKAQLFTKSGTSGLVKRPNSPPR